MELESTDNSPSFTLRNMLIHHVKVTAAASAIHMFSGSSWCFTVTTVLVSTDKSAPASEALPVPEVGEERAAGETARSGRPDEGDQAQMWPHVAQEHARRHPLQVRPVQETHRLLQRKWLSGHTHDRSRPISKAANVAYRMGSVQIFFGSLKMSAERTVFHCKAF